ncbi:MAG: universal stress protein [Burkholderiales bacterium]|nr:universal stress protein [Burkholderiales bacterium]
MYKRILVPVDGSPTSMSGLGEAIRMATLAGASLRLMHVLDAWSYANGFETPAIYCEEVLPHMKQEGARILDEARECVLKAGLAVSTVLIEKVTQRVSELVVAQASEWQADVIVIGSHGRHGFDRVMMGSDAEQIVRHAQVPVLVVREPEDAGPKEGRQAARAIASP